MTHRNWLITGINSGFGREMAEQLLNRGDRVAGTTRNLSALEDLKATHGERLWLAHLDVTDTSTAIRQVVKEAFAAFGRIDVVVSNAGYGLFGAAEEVTDDQVAHQLKTNLVGSIHLVRAVLPFLREQCGGRILQLSSMGGQAVFPGGSLYSATKWGIEGFIDSLNLEVGVFGIACTLVEPGGARTRFRYGSSRLGPKNDAYDASPASHARRMIEEGTSVPIGDPVKMVRLMIESVDQSPAPKRLALGSDSFTVMHKQLSERLAELEAQKDLAFSTDWVAQP
ncbi:SDR family oxidoreductase [Pseudomonas gingeri]|uniref:SDR family oxidoreductase n=1 Tax=Pseudomonas gingeri TaxID=117681 RepID=A0A7Y7YD01_9PSED|nr:SDR family oxidoreductase [Pseudomonas gingeri]NWB26319.1 SDR family oxidoreductase [Pseudomonas gingeri]NWC33940.1 SDR family oxidoreductase [Pseudomonas gingeri]NWD03760.1 SDR family oxidoreductase [Pseudomonas gingeri]NWD48132.1 SDR family oxidoreductase [Pseudomonas gingeri]NWE33558.1 SDR family oxidoreductase [Pseudomonas gingeri]